LLLNQQVEQALHEKLLTSVLHTDTTYHLVVNLENYSPGVASSSHCHETLKSQGTLQLPWHKQRAFPSQVHWFDSTHHGNNL